MGTPPAARQLQFEEEFFTPAAGSTPESAVQQHQQPQLYALALSSSHYCWEEEDMAQPVLFSGAKEQSFDAFAASVKQRHLQNERQNKLGVPHDPGAMLSTILQGLVPDSEPWVLADLLTKQMGRMVAEAGLGYFSRGFTPEMTSRISDSLHITSGKMEHILSRVKQDLQPQIDAAAAEARLGSEHDDPGCKTALWSSLAAVVPAAQQGPPPPPPLHDPSRMAHAPVQVGIELVSPATALGNMLLCALRMIYRAPTQRELDSWRLMAQIGSQGERSAATWAAEVRRVYARINSHPEVPAGQDVRFFITGLNETDERGQPMRASMQLWLQTNPGATLNQAVSHAAELQQLMHQSAEDQMRADFLSGTVSRPRAAGSKAASRAAGSSSQVNTQLQSPDAAFSNEDFQQACRVEGLNAPIITGWLQNARALGVDHPSAVCRVHGLTGSKPHINADCDKQKSQAQQQNGRQRRSRAAASPFNAAAAQQSAASSEVAQLTGLVGSMLQQQQQLQQQFQQLCSSSSSGGWQAAAGQQGLPYNAPRATEPARGGLQQYRSSGVPRHAGPCMYCGYVRGHSPDECYVNNPRLASQLHPDWAPGSKVTLPNLKHYLNRCQEQGVQASLRRTPGAASQLLQGHQLSPQQQQVARAALQQAGNGHYQGAAGQAYGQHLQQPGTPQLTPSWQPPVLPPAQVQQPYIVQPPPSSSSGSVYGQQGGFDATHFYTGCAAQARGQQRLYPPGELASFRPAADLPAADPNTAAGGRAQPPPASQPDRAALDQESSQQLLRLASLLRQLQQAADNGRTPQLGRESLQLLHQLEEHCERLQQSDEAEAAATAAAAAFSHSSDGLSCISSSAGPVDTSSALCPKPLFQAQPCHIQQHLSSHRRMHRVEQPPGLKASIRLLTGDYRSLSSRSPLLRTGSPALSGASIKPSQVCDDNGTNLLVITQEFCRQHGVSYEPCRGPRLKLHTGHLSQPDHIIGRTEPMSLLLGEDTPMPLQVPLDQGVFVCAGDAGGLYELCLDSNTLSPWFAFVNPAVGHLCWYPGGPQGDFSVLNGVPVSISDSRSGSMSATAQAADYVAAAGQRQGTASADSNSAAAAQQAATAGTGRVLASSLPAASSCTKQISAAAGTQQAAAGSVLGRAPAPAAEHCSSAAAAWPQAATSSGPAAAGAPPAAGCCNPQQSAAAGSAQAVTASPHGQATVGQPAAGACSSSSPQPAARRSCSALRATNSGGTVLRAASSGSSVQRTAGNDFASVQAAAAAHRAARSLPHLSRSLRRLPTRAAAIDPRRPVRLGAAAGTGSQPAPSWPELRLVSWWDEHQALATKQQQEQCFQRLHGDLERWQQQEDSAASQHGRFRGRCWWQRAAGSGQQQ